MSVLPPLFVLKFGGTSVSSRDNWQSIEEILRERLEVPGARVLVVCSALSGVSSALIALVQAQRANADVSTLRAELKHRHLRFAQELGLDFESVLGEAWRTFAARLDSAAQDLPPALEAEIVGTGELLSTRLGAAWLASRGLAVRWLDARDWLKSAPRSGPAQYLSAVCSHERSPALQADLRADSRRVFVTQGFIAGSPDGRTSLLGRGGSDTSAAYFAARVGAEHLEIWTDVPGVFTADPRRCKNARQLGALSYCEAQQMASLGAKVLHPRAIPPCRDNDIPIEIRWTRDPQARGTRIGASLDDSQTVRAITSRRGLCLVAISKPRRWQPVGFMADVARCFERHHLSMDLVSSSSSEIRATIDLRADPTAKDRIPALIADLAEECDEVETHHAMASVSLVGQNLRASLHALGESMRFLEGHRVEMVSQAADDSHLTFVVPENAIDELVVHFHQDLFDSAGGTTWTELLADVRARAAVGAAG